MAIEVERASDDRGTAAVVCLPVAVAEQRHFFVAGLDVGVLRGAAQNGANAEHVEGVGCDVVAAQPLRLEITRQFDVADGRGRHAGENVRLLRDFVELLRRVGSPAAFADFRPAQLRRRQGVNILVGKRIDEHAVRHAEHSGGDPDAQGQRYDRRDGKARIAKQLTG